MTKQSDFLCKSCLANDSDSDFLVCEEWRSGLRYCNKYWKVTGSILLGARPGLGTQPLYEAPSDLWVEIVKNAATNIA